MVTAGLVTSSDGLGLAVRHWASTGRESTIRSAGAKWSSRLLGRGRILRP